MKKILIIGATSAIAEHCARCWAHRGEAIFLVGRNAERLNIIAKDLMVRGAFAVDTYCMDLNDIARHPAMLNTAEHSLDGVDTVLIAHGTLSNQKSCEQSVEETLFELKTNALSTISLLTLIANQFEAKKNGTIAIISSVAGERGRASNYVYGSAKAMLTSFTSGLRQRLCRSHVAVVTIKPGFVDTPMTAKFNKGILWTSVTSVSDKIVVAIDKKKDEIYIPGYWWIVMCFIKALPTSIFKLIVKL